LAALALLGIRRRRLVIIGAFITFVVNCGGSSPSGPSDSGGTPTPSTTITLTSNGASPAAVTVPPGTRVLFINNDSTSHDMTSNPHPEHTDCPEVNQVGLLGAGQRRETGNLNTVRTCGFHDHDRPTNIRFQGRIVIQ
jgi:plastocyanin